MTHGLPKDRRSSKNSNPGNQKKVMKTADHPNEKDYQAAAAAASKNNDKLSITSWMCGGGVASTATTAYLSP